MPYRIIRPSKQATFELKSSREGRAENPKADPGEIWGRGRLTFEEKAAVDDAMMRLQLVVNPLTGNVEERRAMSIPMMRKEIVFQYLTDAKTGWNLVGETDRPLERTVRIINEELDPGDLEDLGDQLLQRFYAELFADPSAEGEEEPSSETDGQKSKPSPETTPTST